MNVIRLNSLNHLFFYFIFISFSWLYFYIRWLHLFATQKRRRIDISFIRLYIIFHQLECNFPGKLTSHKICKMTADICYRTHILCERSFGICVQFWYSWTVNSSSISFDLWRIKKTLYWMIIILLRMIWDSLPFKNDRSWRIYDWFCEEGSIFFRKFLPLWQINNWKGRLKINYHTFENA